MRETTNQSPVVEGEIVSGRYRVERVLGIGGMGVVVAATHLQLDQRVALKFLLPDAAAYPEVIERFAREARAAVQIRSEHVARVMDVGNLEDGAPFMVMEYLEGRDLAAVVRSVGRLSVEDTVDYVLQAGEAIAEAHRLGIIHRDLKPSNLFLVESHGVGSGTVKVLDFGISKATSLLGQGNMTQSAAMLGSPAYMSPEQMDSARDVDVRTDIWSLGLVVYELLAGVLPFAGDSLPKLCMEIATRPPAPLRNARPDVPAGLEAVVARCLQKDRTKRFDSVSDLAIALGPFAPRRSLLSIERIRALGTRSGAGAPSSSSVPGLAEPRVATALAPSGRTTHTGWGKTSGNRAPSWPWTLSAVGVVACVAAVGAALLLRAPQPHASAGSDPIRAAASVNATPLPPAPPIDVATATLVEAPPPPTAASAVPTSPSAAPRAALSARPQPVPASSARRSEAPRPHPQEAWEDER